VSQALVHAPRCQREARFSEPRRSLPISATVIRRAGTPDERSTLAREWGFRPATRRHQPMPVASVSWCVAAPETCEPRSVRDGSSHAAFHSRGRDGPWAEEPEQRRARVLGRFARALLVVPRAPVSPARLVVRSGVPRVSSLRPRSPLDAAPRRATPAKGSRCLLPRRNPYASGGLLLRARLDRSPVTPPPKRYCSGTLAPFFEASEAPSPDEESTRSDVTV